jgi:hypothetical protein
VQEYIKSNYLIPYFFGGFMSFVEKGETIKIDNLEFFINDCRPKMGIVDMQTIVEVEMGFTRELFNKKQVLADKRIAERLQQREGSSSSTTQIAASLLATNP